MSTILKALRRLEEDQPTETEAAANATEDAGTPGTDDLRDRVLAEERANQRARAAEHEAAAPGGGADEPSESMPAPLLRHAPLAAAGLVALVIGVMVVPAIFDATDVPPPSGPEGAVSVARAPVAAPVPVDPTTRAEAPPQAEAPVAGRAPVVVPPARSAADARAAVAGAKAEAHAPAAARRAANAGAPRTESVAVADLPVASPPTPEASPLTPEPTPPTPEASPPTPEPTPRRRAERAPAPSVELALVEPTRTPPAAEPPVPAGANAKPTRAKAKPPSAEAKRRASDPPSSASVAKRAPPPPPREIGGASARPAAGPPPAPREKPAPEPIASDDRPVAKTADAMPIERVTRPDVPDVTVLRTSWHPDTTRRSARIRVEASEEVMTLEEGDAIGALVVKEITPSAVLFEAGEVELRRRVGKGS